MHQIQFRLEDYSASPDPVAGFKGPTSQRGRGKVEVEGSPLLLSADLCPCCLITVKNNACNEPASDFV